MLGICRANRWRHFERFVWRRETLGERGLKNESVMNIEVAKAGICTVLDRCFDDSPQIDLLGSGRVFARRLQAVLENALKNGTQVRIE